MENIDTLTEERVKDTLLWDVKDFLWDIKTSKNYKKDTYKFQLKWVNVKNESYGRNLMPDK